MKLKQEYTLLYVSLQLVVSFDFPKVKKKGVKRACRQL